MVDSRFKMNDATKEYYKDSLSLLQSDLFGAGGYDEVYIVNVKDFAKAHLQRADPDLIGIPFVDQGEGIRQLRESHPDYYAALKNRFSSQEFSSGGRMGLPPFFYSESALSINVTGVGGLADRKIGIVFMSDHLVNGMGGMRGYGNGFSSAAENHLSEKERENFDDYKKFIVLPHEVGHLVDMNQRGLYQLDTFAPLDSPETKERAALFLGKIHRLEISADEYAQDKFMEATQRGFTKNPMLMGTALNYRTLNSIEHSLYSDGDIAVHSTSPFMKGAAFQGYDTDSYKQAMSTINHDIDYAAAKLMGDYVSGAYENDRTFWARSIRECFASAADDSYDRRKILGKAYERDTGSAPDILPPNPAGISGAFRTCMIGDFSNRYQFLVEQYIVSEPDTPEGQLLNMYVGAVEDEVPAEEIERTYNYVPPVTGMKP